MLAIPPLLTRRILLGLCFMAAGACTPRTRPPDPGVTAVRSGGSTIHVVNRQWVDMRIYVTTVAGMTYRLGIVPVLGSGTFLLPASVRMPAELTFFALPLGTDDPLTVGPIALDVGSRVLFTLEKTGSASAVVKRP